MRRYDPKPWDIRRCDMVHADEGEYVLYSDARAEIERLDRTALAERNRALEEALAPFANIADLFDSEVEGHSDTDELSLFYGDEANWLADRFTLAQFNAARAALTSGGRG